MDRRRWATLAGRLLGASVIAQVAVLAATAVALPSLAPTDLALYGFVLGACTMSVTINTWAVETRIAVTDERVAHSLRRAGTAVVIIAGLLWLVAGLGLTTFSSHWAATAAFLSAAGSTAMGLHALAAAIMLRRQQQRELADARVVQGVSNALLILALLALPTPRLFVLPIAWILSTCAALVIMSRALGPAWGVPERPRREDWTALRKETGHQPLANVLAGAVEPMPLVLLPIIASPALAGGWALLTRFLQPLVMTTYSALQPVYYGQAAQLAREGRWPGLSVWHRRWMLLLAAAVVPAGMAFYLISIVLPMLLGPEWSSASWLAWAATAYYVSLLVCLPLSQTLLVLGRLRTQLRWAATRFAVSVTPFALSHWWPAERILVLWIVASSVAFYAQLGLHRRALADIT